jgi:protein-disulfide isomerase
VKLNLPYIGQVTVELPYLAGGLVGTLVVLGALGYWMWGTGPASIATAVCTPKDTVPITADDYTRGDAKAPITIVEYASMTCPHCARFSNNVLPHLKADYVDKGYVRYVFREFPLDAVALTISVVGRCLGRDGYLPFVERMYQTQQQWGSSASGPELRAAIKELARRAGLSSDAFEQCLTKGDKDAQKISDGQKMAVQDYCVAATPSFFMNGKPLANGEIAYSEMDQKIRAELTRLGKKPPPPSAAALGTEPTTPAPAGEGAPAPAGGNATPPAETPATAPPAATTPAPAAPATPH